MHMELRKMADFCYIQEMASKAHFGLGNRCSVRLSYGGDANRVRSCRYAVNAN